MVGVRATREGILVLHHASTLGRRRLSKLTHEQASERARDRGLELATLAKAVDAADPVPVNAELATADHAAPVVDELRRHEHPDRSLATAFRPDPLERVHDRVPRIDTGLLLSPARALRLLYRRKRAEILQRRVEALPVDALIPELLGPAPAGSADRHRVPVPVWTVNRDRRLHLRIAHPPVDGVVTDRARRAVHLRRAGRAGPPPGPGDRAAESSLDRTVRR